jgi:hypothetical protein
MSKNKVFITITSPFKLNGKWFSVREQLCYECETIIMAGEYSICEKSEDCLPMSEIHHKGSDEEGNIFYIPERFSVLDTVHIPKDEMSMFNRVAKRKQDKTKDYFKAVESALGIDMRLNYKPQINPKHYERIDLIPPDTRLKNNRDQEGNL